MGYIYEDINTKERYLTDRISWNDKGYRLYHTTDGTGDGDLLIDVKEFENRYAFVSIEEEE